jgi:predicted phage baseplate assembly protein
MVSSVTHDFDPNLPKDKTHTTLTLATPMAYTYKLDTVYVYGNVVKATHGETRNEALGSGSGQALQSFALRQRPLTYVSAPTAAGAASSLHVFVNGVEWHETDALAGLAPTDRMFVTEQDDSGVTTVLFGDGEQGARPPTGMENVNAVYRTGIGFPGNVQARQITLLQTKPLGVKSIVNPLEASGGADREDLDQVRQNAPLAVMALDRLVSVPDYADFARTFAGIAKAAAQQTTDGHRELIYLTIAEVADADLDVNSDLYRNLLTAFETLGDADFPVQVVGRERIALLLSAHIRLEPDYQWDLVVAAVRAALLDRFGFERRSLGQAAVLSEALAVMGAVEGVDYVDVDVFGGIADHRTATDGSRVLLTPPEISQAVADVLDAPITATSNGQFCQAVMAFPGGRDPHGSLRPAQLAIFTPDVPQALILNQII